jgi:membrane protease YdiL (CAAX protease family)
LCDNYPLFIIHYPLKFTTPLSTTPLPLETSLNEPMKTTGKESIIAGLILAGMATTMFIPLILWLINAPDDLFSRMGFTATATKIPLAWIAALVTAGAYIIHTAYGSTIVRQNLFKFNRFKLIGIYAAIPTGVMEEIFFRQMVMDWLQNAGANVALQVAASALLFGAAHGLWGLFARDKKFIVGAVASTAALGLLLAAIYAIGSRNVLPAIAAHMTINLFIEPWLVLSAVKSLAKRNL